jgi:glycosyltransferase involved in cell wall biosynthesis
VQSSAPHVTVVTPLYNGAEHLRDCMESVLAQCYQNWTHVLVNNCSTDASLVVAQEIARRDARVRVVDCREFLPMAMNWNRSLDFVPAESAYCKFVHPDDTLMPDCLQSMVELAERHPEVGLVGASRMIVRGGVAAARHPLADGRPADRVISGRRAARLFFESGRSYLGSPSAVMIRASHLRRGETFFNRTSHYMLDMEAWLNVLRDSSLGFIDQVLTTSREHSTSQTSSTYSKVAAKHLSMVYIAMKFAPDVLEPDEARTLVERYLLTYHWFLIKTVAKGDRRRWRYHRETAAALGVPISVGLAARMLASRLTGSAGVEIPEARLLRSVSAADP